MRITDNLEDFDVVERPLETLSREFTNVTHVRGVVASVDAAAHTVTLQSGEELRYRRLCVCSGGRPKLALQHPFVLGVRDTHTVDELRRRVEVARRVVVLGNGGIALEFVHAVDDCEVVWAIRDEYIGNTFFDASASRFLLEARDTREKERSTPGKDDEREPHDHAAAVGADAGEASVSGTDRTFGNSLGPMWVKSLKMSKRARYGAGGGAGGGQTASGLSSSRKRRRAEKRIVLERRCEITGIRRSGATVWDVVNGTSATSSADGDADGARDRKSGLGSTGGGSADVAAASLEEDEREWPVFVQLSNGRVYGCDVILSATGVSPAVEFLGPEFRRGEDGGVLVDDHMRTTGSPDVFAAGDAASIGFSTGAEWFQMRLWSQARAMGMFAAHCLADAVDDLMGGFSFELFAHATQIMGFKVVLLGLFNGQSLGADYERVIKSRVVTEDGVTTEEGVEGAGGAAKRVAEGVKRGAPAVQLQVRVSPGQEYIKVTMLRGRVVGAMLIGDTDLEETFENLILNKTDVGGMGLDLLNPAIDLEDYFD